jgi:uncharacterized protein YjbI with pentapeptide repeats
MCFRSGFVALALMAVTASSGRADIFRWDNNQVIPGTAGITPGPGVQLGNWNTGSRNLRYADFSAVLNLSGAQFQSSWLDYAHFQGANLTGSRLDGATLAGALFRSTNLINASLAGATLTAAGFSDSTLTNANFSGAVLTVAGFNGASFVHVTSRGFTKEQLYTTSSYQDKNLTNVSFSFNDLTEWDFANQNLTDASFFENTLTNANLTGTVVTGASFANTTSRGLTEVQLKSTKSFNDKNLARIGLEDNDLTGWDFSGQNLTQARFAYYSCGGVPLRGSVLSDTNFAGADLTDAFLNHTTLLNANMSGADLTNAQLSSADTRGAQHLDLTGADSVNAILPGGNIDGLDLDLWQKLVVRDEDGVPDPPLQYWLTPREPIPVTVKNHMTMSDGGVLQLLFGADPWDSLISFDPGIPVTLGGTLELSFTDDVNLASQLGRTLHIFDWTGVSPTGEFQVSSPYAWDLSKLYTTGEVTLTAVPEPSTIVFAAFGLALGVLRWSRRRNAPGIRRTPLGQCIMALIFLVALAASGRAAIFRWDNGQVIPGTEGITPVPGVNLSDWNTDSHNLRYADFSAGLNLSDASFIDSWLENAHFQGANLNNAVLYGSTLTNADLSGTTVTGAFFFNTTGFTKEQLYSTASYQANNLQGIFLGRNDLSGWDFSGQNLTGASLSYSTQRNASLGGATVIGADFSSFGLTKDQLYSTASYQANNLQGIGLGQNDLSGWDFSEQNLTGASLSYSTLTGADLSVAAVTGADFRDTTSRGFTAAQLYSTASYQANNLQGIGLGQNDLSGWDFQQQNLANSDLSFSTLTDANLTGAVVTKTDFRDTTSRGFTAAQLYSTQSYQAKNLAGIDLISNDLSGWDFEGQNLANAELGSSNLTSANLAWANLTNAELSDYSCCANQGGSDLTDANLTGANLANTYVVSSTFTNANLSGTDIRGAQGLNLAGAISRNAILANGLIAGLDLTAVERLLVRDDDGVPGPQQRPWLKPREPIPITVQNYMTMSAAGVLQLLFESDPWDSLISFEPGTPVTLGGTLELSFVPEVDLSAQLGRTLHIFDWTGVTPTGELHVVSPYSWDLSKLYTTGKVTLTAVPEPSTLAFAACGLAAGVLLCVRLGRDTQPL